MKNLKKELTRKRSKTSKKLMLKLMNKQDKNGRKLKDYPVVFQELATQIYKTQQ